MNLQEIYNHLFSGKKLQLTFQNFDEMNSFRVKLHQLKLLNEKPAVAIDLIKEEDRERLNFKALDDTYPSRFNIYLSPKAQPRQYVVKIIEA